MKKILFIAEKYIYENDGYKTRIVMELELLKDYFDICIFVPDLKKELDLPVYVKVYKYTYPTTRLPIMLNLYGIRQQLNSLLDKIGNVIVYCEALPIAIMALQVCKARKINLVYDCHGAAAAEVYFKRHNWVGYLYSKWLCWQEQKVVAFSALVITVSKKQAGLFKCGNKNVLLPMVPGEHFFNKKVYRDEIRKKLNINSNALVFVYCGQNQKWQMSEETIQIYKKIEKYNTNSRLLVLTNDVDEFKFITDKYKINNPIVLKIPYHEVPQYLDACDFGFCLRNDNIINLVASPTKVLEYVSRNVVPILTEHVGDFSRDLLQDKIAYVIDINSFKEFNFVKKDFDGSLYVRKKNQECVEKYVNRLLSLGE